MLVITRKPREGVWIGDIKVVIIECSNHKVKIGIDAPEDVEILREELLGRDDIRRKFQDGRK